MSDRASSRDGERHGEWPGLRHQHSMSSDQGSVQGNLKALIPMWDSSDPERAPPPLPLNPQSPAGMTSRAGTSAAIQSAHAALNERAMREQSTALVPGPSKRIINSEASPERPTPKSFHRRTQTLQPGSVRDLSLMLEGGPGSPVENRSANRSPERLQAPASPTSMRTRETSEGRELGPGPSLTPVVRPQARRPPPQSILGENTPPQSSTMMALHTLSSNSPSTRSTEPALSNITNSSNGPSPTKNQSRTEGIQNLEDISGQILTLTSIATALQKEMHALSRRSRDNATDLLSLKEATTTRDEDIRRHLRELTGSITESSNRLSSAGGLYLDNKPHHSPPQPQHARSMFQLPRIPSPKSFAESLDTESTPSLVGGSGEAAASSLVLLERIIREMGTKEGQDSLISRLTEVSQKLTGMASSAKVDEILDLVKTQSPATGPVAARDFAGPSDELELEGGRGGRMTQRVQELMRNEGRRASVPSSHGSDILSDDVVKIIRSVKDSVHQSGGMTAEVKALVRELRGEVLGMGRELGQQLEKFEHQVQQRSPENDSASDAPTKEDVSRVIDEGLEQMKNQLNHVLREHRRQSSGSAQSNRNAVDYQEIYNAMRAALRDDDSVQEKMPDLSREDVVDAVREAWENYKPEIEVQQLGLERDEVLAVLQEGLQEYAPDHDKPVGASRDEVFQAVVEGLKHFDPPKMETSATISRDEIIEAVRDCLEEFEFPVAASAVGNEINTEDVTRAVQEGILGAGLGAAAGAAGAVALSGGDNSDITTRLQDLMEYMKLEFKAVSEEAKDNVAANGRDTEQVLDAIKDGLENLRANIEGYVDRSTGVDAQDQFLDDLTKSVDEFKEELAQLLAEATEKSQEQLGSELEKLRDMMQSSMVPASSQATGAGNNEEVLEALHSGISTLRQEIMRPRTTETGEIIDAINEGLQDLKHTIERISDKPADLTANDEILDALKSGLDSVRSEIDSIKDSGADRAVALNNVAPSENAIAPADMVKQDDIKNLEVLITALQIKVEAMGPDTDSVHRDDLSRLEDMLKEVQGGVEEIKTKDTATVVAEAVPTETKEATLPENAATKEDVEAIETILRNTKDKIDDLVDGEQAVKKDQIDSVETVVLETKEGLASVADKIDAMPDKSDIAAIGTLIAAITAGVEEMKDRASKTEEHEDKVSKTDIEAVETVVLEMKATVDAMALTDLTTLSQKEDLTKIETLLSEAKETLNSHAEATTKGLEDRQAELVGVGERVLETRTILEEFQTFITTKMAEDENGIESVGKLLEAMGEKIDKNENVGQDVKEMLETMKAEFETSRDVIAGAKLESDEKLQETRDAITTTLEEKLAEVIAKYDELQTGIVERSAASEAKGVETEAAVTETKAIAEELRTLVDTLGSTVTDSLEKMEEASQTVFSKVEDLSTKTDDMHIVEQSEHEKTRETVQQAVTAVEGMQGEMKDFQPQILDAVKEVLVLVGQHFEHSKTSTSDIRDKIEETKPNEEQMQKLLAPPPAEKYDDTEVKEELKRLVASQYDDSEVKSQLALLMDSKYDDTDLRAKLDTLSELKYDDTELKAKLDTLSELKYDDAELKAKLDALSELKYDDTELKEKLAALSELKYDDAEVRERLDRLVEAKHDDATVHEKLDAIAEHSISATEKFSQLDKVHESVLKTAAEISEFLASQTQRITDEQEDRERTLQEANIALERTLGQQIQAETTIESLRDEEDRLRASVLALRNEQESLIRQKTRLTGDVSSLETALKLRKEEFVDMESRAEALERRILEGVMDHSRVMLMSKSSRNADKMNRKRVRKQPNADDEVQSTRSATKPAMNLALASARQSLAPSGQIGVARRIVSLSQMTNNTPTGGVKRSQSTRTPGVGAGAKSMRKRSWGGAFPKAVHEQQDDKENMQLRETVEEVEEPATPEPRAQYIESSLPGDETTALGTESMLSRDSRDEDGDETDRGSDVGTLRRSSRGTTILSGRTSDMYSYTESEMSYDDTASEWTENAVGVTPMEGGEGGEMVVYGA